MIHLRTISNAGRRLTALIALAVGFLFMPALGHGAAESAAPTTQTATRAVDSPHIVRIAAGENALIVRLAGCGGEAFRLLELEPFVDDPTTSATRQYPVAWEGRSDGAEFKIPRIVERRDRLYRKFQLARVAGNTPIGAPQYVTDLSALAARDFEIPWPTSKKGLTCITDLQDAIKLGIKYADDSVVLSELIDWRNPKPEATWEVDGEKIPINMNYVRQLDHQIKGFTDAGINYTPILVNIAGVTPEPGNPLVNPATDLAHAPMHIVAFNLTDARGVRCYRAAIEYLADRYTRPDKQYGLISGIVIGNEVQSHWVWHNMGEVNVEQVAHEYTLALRVADLAARRAHRGLRVYASLEHHWTKRGMTNNPKKECRGRELLTLINDGARAEGNFPWHLAFHPYPDNLFEPRFWLDKNAPLRLDAPKITFKNIEVLPVFMRQEAFLYNGQPRHIVLTEQGFHSPEGPDGEKIQAAAYAYAFYKISHMPEIDCFILHRHVSTREEGGLMLGLWTNDPNGKTGFEPGRKKFIWDVFRQADTPAQEQAFAFALPLAGLKDWSEALPAKEIDTRPAPQLDQEQVVYDLYEHMSEAKVENSQCWIPEDIIRAGGWLAPSIFQHPPKTGVGRATYTVALPQPKPGKRLALHLETLLPGGTEDGVGFSVLVDGQSVWHTEQKADTPVAQTIDLTAHAGKTVQLTLQVDPLGNPNHDWAHWVQPVIMMEDAGASGK